MSRKKTLCDVACLMKYEASKVEGSIISVTKDLWSDIAGLLLDAHNMQMQLEEKIKKHEAVNVKMSIYDEGDDPCHPCVYEDRWCCECPYSFMARTDRIRVYAETNQEPWREQMMNRFMRAE